MTLTAVSENTDGVPGRKEMRDTIFFNYASLDAKATVDRCMKLKESLVLVFVTLFSIPTIAGKSQQSITFGVFP